MESKNFDFYSKFIKSENLSKFNDIMSEASTRGYDTRVLRKIIAIRKKDPQVVSEEDAVLELYKEALGM